MTAPAKPDPKLQALASHGTLNPHPEGVTDELFGESDFFDARDATQVKYEMLRKVQVGGASVVEAARAFGLSRPTFYESHKAFEADGLAGLLPKKKGPQRAHKLSAEVMAYVAEVLRSQPGADERELARRIEARFGVHVHPRSVQRALQRPAGKA